MYIIETAYHSYTVNEKTMEGALLRFVTHLNPSAIDSVFLTEINSAETCLAKVKIANNAVNNMIKCVRACVTMYEERDEINAKPKRII